MTPAQEFARAIDAAKEGYDDLRLMSDNERALGVIDALEAHHVALLEKLIDLERAMFPPEPVTAPGFSLKAV